MAGLRKEKIIKNNDMQLNEFEQSVILALRTYYPVNVIGGKKQYEINLRDINSSNDNVNLIKEIVYKVLSDNLKENKQSEIIEVLEKIIYGYENSAGEMWIPDMIGEHIDNAKHLIN